MMPEIKPITGDKVTEWQRITKQDRTVKEIWLYGTPKQWAKPLVLPIQKIVRWWAAITDESKDLICGVSCMMGLFCCVYMVLLIWG